MLQRGYLAQGGSQIMLPVFGLYANSVNNVTVTVNLMDGSSTQMNQVISTDAFSDPCGFNNRTIIQPRTSSTLLSYDFILAKNKCGSTYSPAILDTDGAVRWVGTAPTVSSTAGLLQNSVFLGSGNNFYRIEFDGAFSTILSNSAIAFHHNLDPGKLGIIADWDTGSQVESYNVEIDRNGNVLKSWDLAGIISNAMTAGGDDPSQFVYPTPTDWFHNNAVTYRKSDNSLVISSRENFVIAIDYDTGAIKWILGDSTKKWYQFPSLRRYALALGPNTLPPIGQHAVSFTADDKLLLFDDGQNSIFQMPPGQQRTYSAARKYDLDLTNRVATEVWNFTNGQSLFSPYCSSIYEDLPSHYLIDYAIISNLPGGQYMELLGLEPSGAKVFDYRYATTSCNTAWNSIQIHLEQVQFTTVVPINVASRMTQGTAGTFDLKLPLNSAPVVESRSGGVNKNYQIVFTFAKNVTAPSATVTPAAGKTASVVGSPVVSGNQVTVNLTNVANAQTLLVSLVNVSDGTNTDTVSMPVTILVGDVNGSGNVNSTDVSVVKTASGYRANAANYRYDVTGNGVVDAADISLVKANSGQVAH